MKTERIHPPGEAPGESFYEGDTRAMRKGVEKRMDVLERLLTTDESVHPPACMCAIKSRRPTDHASECPYRMTIELISELRAVFRRGSDAIR